MKNQDPGSSRRLMPVLFVGHGNPMNGIEDNEFTQRWEKTAKTIPRPEAIICISAHWEVRGTLVTAMEKPKTIADFYGFPNELYKVKYPAPGSPSLAQEVKELVKSVKVGYDDEWGLDHGCWVVMKRMFPAADIPIIQLSLDYTRPAKFHYDLAAELAPLRKKGVLIVGSGNMVHNLRMVSWDDFNQPFGFDWAIEANDLFKKLIKERRDRELIDYPSLGKSAQLAIPTPEHYLPMLSALALREKDEPVRFYNDKPLAGSLTMTSFVIGG